MSTHDTWVTNDDMTATRLNNMERGLNITCTSTTRPTDVTDGMEILESDTGLKLRYRLTRWTYTAWDDIDFNAPAMVGTKPSDVIALPLMVWERNETCVTLNSSGGFEFNYPEVFPNCILSVIVVACNGISTPPIVSINAVGSALNLTKWSGQAFVLNGTSPYGVAAVGSGNDVQVAYRVVGC